VEIHVGPDERTKTFMIHQGIIRSQSTVFDKDFYNPNINNVVPQVVTFQDIEPEPFGLFVQWLYYHSLHSEDPNLPHSAHLVELWSIGNRFRMPSLQNAVMRSLHSKSELTASPNVKRMLKTAYSETPGSRNLR
jgi:hypothetical protein